jgi:hypothetical protein
MQLRFVLILTPIKISLILVLQNLKTFKGVHKLNISDDLTDAE